MEDHTRPAISWLVLTAATLVSFISVETSGWTKHLLTELVLTIAFLKAVIVGHEFMDLREAPLVMRGIFVVWSAGMCALLIGFFVA